METIFALLYICDGIHLNKLLVHDSNKENRSYTLQALCEVTGGFPFQGISHAENVSLW